MFGIASKIMKRVRGHGSGTIVFTWKDFQDFGARGSVDQALARLVHAGKLRRVARGMYDLPRASKLLRGPAPANTDAVLDAVRRHDQVSIKPDDIAAANRPRSYDRRASQAALPDERWPPKYQAVQQHA